MRSRSSAMVFACALLTSPLWAGEEVDLGRRIYQEGVLPSGAPLRAVGAKDAKLSGAAAACITCHRRSGMGGLVGEQVALPVTASSLFAVRRNPISATATIGSEANPLPQAYTDESLARALTQGISGRNGHSMHPVMPRYELSASDTRALTAYLRTLSAEWSSGVDEEAIHLATVITPGVDPQRKATLITTLNAAVAQHNRTAATERTAGRVARNWKLEVWELSGAPEAWDEELEAHYLKQPVFALLSGLSLGMWQPVHAFCEQRQIPCWFPSVDLPATEQTDYNFYFSRGTLLEAEVVASYLLAEPSKPKRVVQILRDEPAANAAAQTTTQALDGSGITVERRVLRDAWDPLLADLGPGDTLLFWLRPADLTALRQRALPTGVTPIFSAELGADRASVPAAWTAQARLIYPFELPQRRRANLGYLRTWLNANDLTLTDEQLQAEAYFASEFLAGSLTDMGDALYRDYLVERATLVLSKQLDAETEERMRIVRPTRPRRPRAGNLLYPTLRFMGTSHFTSQGAYVVRLGEKDELLQEIGWTVP